MPGNLKNETIIKGIESLPQTLNFLSQYLYNVIYLFQTMNSVKVNHPSLKYFRLTSSDCKNLGIRITKFVPKPQFPKI